MQTKFPRGFMLPRASGVVVGGLLLTVSALSSCAQPVATGQRGTLTVKVNQPGVKISPMFYGLMTEEINHAYDGGLYAELIQNRDLKDNEKQPVHWSLVQKSGTGSLALDPTQQVPGTALTHCLRLDVKDAGGPLGVGASNDGYWGVPVNMGMSYNVSFYAKARPGYTGKLSLAFENKDGSQNYGTTAVPQLTSEWKKYTITVKAGNVTPKAIAGRFTIYATGTGTVYLTHVSMMPPTYKNRPNGNRPDLMQLMTDMNQSFLRLPGGNYLEGETIPTRFDWKATLGPTEGRPGHPGTWSYRSSDGLGLLDFLNWCDDIGVEPVLAVYGGYSLRGDHVNPGPDLQPYVDDALDEIEYLIGDAKTPWGARRIADGHPAPFKLRYVEIGNEDFFDRSGSYPARFAQFHNAIKAKYPQLQTISTGGNVATVRPDVIDDHYYRSAAAMANDAHHYDNYDRTGPKIFVGEWASTEGSPTPTLMAALGDAAWLTGLERNSDHVIMQCYAPLLVNVNKGASQWGTNLIGYDAMTAFGSPSYYVQKMFATNKGDTVLPVDLQAASAMTMPAPHGGIGLGTWLTQAEYRNIKVTGPNGQTLMQSDFGAGTAKAGDWTPKTGEWRVQDGAFRQTGNGENARALSGDPNWGDYTLTLQARKLSGSEGFLVLFHAKDDDYLWWNIGGWGNTRTAIEKAVGGSKSQLGPDTPTTVETGRWYNIRVEVKGTLIRCFLDDKLITEVRDVPPSAMYATSSRDSATGDIILKVVNMSESAQPLQINLQGAQGVGGTATATILSGQPNDVNTVEAPTKVVPRTVTVAGASANFPYTFPAYSTTVMRLKARR